MELVEGGEPGLRCDGRCAWTLAVRQPRWMCCMCDLDVCLACADAEPPASTPIEAESSSQQHGVDWATQGVQAELQQADGGPQAEQAAQATAVAAHSSSGYSRFRSGWFDLNSDVIEDDVEDEVEDEVEDD